MKIIGSTNDITVNEGVIFEDVNIKLSTGDINLNIKEVNLLEISSSTGDIIINDLNVKDYMKIHVSTGDVKLIDVKVGNDFNLNGGTSEVKLERFDAKNITVKVSTGDVTGSLLSPKMFDVKTSTGKIIIPESKVGGVCKIRTSTGNVIITYA